MLRAVLLLAAWLVALANLGACKKSTCEKYADMEVKCDVIPAAEAEMTRALAQGMCSEAPPPGAEDFGKMLRREANCAVNTSDCAVYKVCTAKARAVDK